MITVREAQEIVDSLNEAMKDSIATERWYVYLAYADEAIKIKFLGQHVWFSEESLSLTPTEVFVEVREEIARVLDDLYEQREAFKKSKLYFEPPSTEED